MPLTVNMVSGGRRVVVGGNNDQPMMSVSSHDEEGSKPRFSRLIDPGHASASGRKNFHGSGDDMLLVLGRTKRPSVNIIIGETVEGARKKLFPSLSRTLGTAAATTPKLEETSECHCRAAPPSGLLSGILPGDFTDSSLV